MTVASEFPLTKVKTPHLVILSSATLYLLMGPRGSNLEGADSDFAGADDAFDALPDVLPVSTLRGGRGAPASFKWVSRGPGQAVVGSTFKTSLRALDAKGRSACPTACEAFQVDFSLTGPNGEATHAQLAGDVSDIIWRGAELPVVVEDSVVEDVQLEVKIRNPETDEIFTRTMRIEFTPAPPESVKLYIRPTGASSSLHFEYNGSSGGTWPTHVVFEAVLSAQDRFGNQVPLGSNTSRTSGPVLRSSSQALEIITRGGEFDSDKPNPVVRLRGREPGNVEIWLENTGGVVNGPSRLQVSFVDYLPSARPDSQENISSKLSTEDSKWQPLANEVREAFLHAWKGYRRYAWGKDELEPLSQAGHDSFGNIGMIVLDSLTTLWLMGLHKEFEVATKFVDNELDFDTADREVSVFELNIRALGGLLGAHALSGKRIFLQRATELGERLLPALDSPSGFPWPRWNIARSSAKPTTEPTILAEAGSLQLEFRYLTALTGDPRYRNAVDTNFAAIQATTASGLKPVHLTSPGHSPPEAINDRLAVGALADSYYEYLLKQWLQSPQESRFKDLWMAVMDELPTLVQPAPEPLPKGATPPNYKILEMTATGRLNYRMEHLSCFTPGMIALGLRSVPKQEIKNRNATWFQMAQGLAASCAELWTSSNSGLAPEWANVSPKTLEFQAVDAASHSFLRPETAESLFYLFRITGDPKWRELGAKIFRAIVDNAKVDGGFASVKNVQKVPTQKMNEMQSFVMAETFKYLYLLFSPAETLDLDKFVLNTEAHPLRVLGPW